MSTPDITTVTHIRMAAMNLLSMREHSAQELYQKLLKKFDNTELVHDAIESLKADGLQSDLRYTEAFIRMRQRQGKGSLSIRLELRNKGIAMPLLEENVASADDWNALALKVYRKKFGDELATDIKEKSKRMRFLSTRGFTSANIHYVFQSLAPTK